MKTAFIVLTYNRADALLAVLRSLAPQCGADSEVLIADDGSDPEHVRAFTERLPRFQCRVRHVWHPDTGFAAARARNLAAARTAADYLVFLDGDCVPTGHFAMAHLRLAQAGHFVNGSRVLLSERLSTRVSAGEVDPGTLDAREWLQLRKDGDVNKLSHLLSWPGAPFRVTRQFRWKGIRSCNFGVWSDDFQAVNGFDEDFSGWGHEDADLVLRLHRKGLARKDGFWSTEVFHLWHHQNSRAAEEPNRRRVLERIQGQVVRAETGLAEGASAAGVVERELG